VKPYHQFKTSHGFGLCLPAVKAVELDGATMSARAIFATDSLDRVGDVIHVPGIDTANHQKNPVVLFNHGQQFAIPIGKTVDEAGNYTVEVGEHEAYQRTFFSQSLLEAEQIYRLIEEGVISANSIGYRPLQAKRLKADPNSITKPGLYLERVELLEVSWVGVPANQDCVRAALSRDKVCGKSLAPAIRRGLLPLLRPSTTVTVPLTRKGGQPMSKSVKADPADEVNTPAQNDPPTAPKTDEVSPEEVAGTGADAAQLPLGAEILTAVHTQLVAVAESVNGQMERLENEEVSNALTDLMEGVFEQLAGIEELFRAEYPDLDPLPEVGSKADEPEEKPAEKPEGEADEPAEKSDDEKPKDEAEAEKSGSKSYSDGHKRFTKAQGSCLKDAAEALGEMSGADNLDKTQKVTLRYYAREIGQMVAEPEAPEQSKAGDEDLSPEQKRLVEAKIKRLELLVAHKKRLARQKALRGK
jgi:HK97 family phage prohead protease